jgi:hypothetical protein
VTALARAESKTSAVLGHKEQQERQQMKLQRALAAESITSKLHEVMIIIVASNGY